MIQFNSNTTDGLYCGSSNTCSAPATTRSPFLKCTCIPLIPPTRTRPLFFVFPSPLPYTTVRSYETVICGWRLHPKFLHRWSQKWHSLHAQNTMCQRIAGEGEGGKLKLRTRWVCDVHGRVRSRVRMCGWGNSGRHDGRRNGRLFKKKRGGRKEKKGRFVRKSTSFHSFSPYSRKIFDCSKLNSCFCAW